MKLKSVAYICKTLAVVGLLTPRIGLPFSIGEIHLNSGLNQTVNAEFKLNLAEGENPSDISVRLATPEKFEQAGITWNQFLSNLQIQTTSQGNGSITVKVSSKEPITNPSLNFLVEISGPQGSQIKEFKTLTAPAFNQTQLGSPVTTDNTNENVKPIKKIPGFNLESLNASATEYGPIKANDTLWGIATHLGKERGVSTRQMLTALQKTNPNAFNNGSINSLKPDVMLQIPSAEAVTALTSKPTPTAPTPTSKKKALELAAPTAETSITDKTEVGSQAKSETIAETLPVIANSPTNGNNEFLALQTKISGLEQQINMMQQLLALKDQQLAILQNANKNQFAQANPTVLKPELIQPSPLLIASLGLSLLAGVGWLLWRRNQQDQQHQRDAELIFANDLLQATVPTNDTFSFESIPVEDQEVTDQRDVDFELDFIETPISPKITDVTNADWADDGENETKIENDTFSFDQIAKGDDQEQSSQDVDFNLDFFEEPTDTPKSVEPSKTDSANDNTNEPKIDNDGFSFDQIANTDSVPPSKNDFDFNLDFFEAPTAVKLTDANASDWADEDDENETKIDMAKAYIDMGDLEMAKIIAEEVMKSGNAQQKGLAQALLAEI